MSKTAEQPLFDNGLIVISRAVVRTPGSTYAISQVVAARVERLPARHWMPRGQGPFTAFGVCVAAGLAGALGLSTRPPDPALWATLLVLGAVGALVAVLAWGREPAGHHLVLTTAAGERAIRLPDAESARRAIVAVRRAMDG